MLGVTGGGLALGAAAGPALVAVAESIQRRSVTGTGTFVAVADLDALPDDGTPVSLPVVIEAPIDGWNRLPPTEVGQVWLVRNGSDVRAWSNVCPHLGCGIDWVPDREQFLCPCHDSWFSPDGEVLSGPSPRAMDTFEVRVVGEKVEVEFQKFVLGTADKRLA